MKIVIAFSLFFLSSHSFAETQDKAIYDALSVRELPLPTPYPFFGFQKAVGRLTCLHMTNSQTQEESYSCALRPMQKAVSSKNPRCRESEQLLSSLTSAL